MQNHSSSSAQNILSKHSIKGKNNLFPSLTMLDGEKHASSSIQETWNVVTGKKKKVKELFNNSSSVKYAAPKISKTQQKKKALLKNKFFLLTFTEKKLQNLSSTEQLPSKKSNNLKCFQRNQRRSRKREEKRAAMKFQEMKQSSMVFPEKEETLVDSTIVSSEYSVSNISCDSPLYPSDDSTETPCDGTLNLSYFPNETPKTVLDLPDTILNLVLSFLNPRDVLLFGTSNKMAQDATNNKHLWKFFFASKYQTSMLMFTSLVSQKNSPLAAPVKDSDNLEYILSCMNYDDWKLAYQLTSTDMLDYLRCSYSRQTFFQTILGVGIDFTVNPKTKQVDYIKMGQDLWSKSSFIENQVDAFGNSFKVFLPFYFSDEHFHRALPLIHQAIVKLYFPSKKHGPNCAKSFQPKMVLDVLPKIMNTLIVLVADEGVATSRKTFQSLLYAYRLFLALAKEYPSIRKDALLRLRSFSYREENRTKAKCPRLGELLPLLMIVDEKDFSWRHIQEPYLEESFTRSVLWICKAHPKLERTHTPNGVVESPAAGEERIKLTREAMAVSTRLTMFNVYFLRACCRGNLRTRSYKCDIALRQPIAENSKKSNENKLSNEEENNETKSANEQGPASVVVTNKVDLLSFAHFQLQVTRILGFTTWHQFFHFINARCPSSKAAMAQMLRKAVRKSRQRGYHKAGMDFSRVHASGTSTILAKGQQYSASSDLKKVVFSDSWGFSGGTKYLDATCLVYEGKKLLHTVDYSNTRLPGNSSPIIHSGDIIEENRGTHTIHLNLEALKESITTCVFVLSAWASATLSDITTASISFRDADFPPNSAPLCEYNLDAHDKVAHLTSVIMCKLYRARGGWHVVSIGDAHRGDASNYEPIYKATQKLL